MSQRLLQADHLQCSYVAGGLPQGVKDINFSNDGRRFLSTSYDKVVKLWDTETGQVGAPRLPRQADVATSTSCWAVLASP